MLSESMVLDVWNRWSLIGIQITIKTLSSWLYKLVSMDPTPRLCDSSSYCCSVTEKHTCSGVRERCKKKEKKLTNVSFMYVCVAGNGEIVVFFPFLPPTIVW